jgi:hypothetical protein
MPCDSPRKNRTEPLFPFGATHPHGSWGGFAGMFLPVWYLAVFVVP